MNIEEAWANLEKALEQENVIGMSIMLDAIQDDSTAEMVTLAETIRWLMRHENTPYRKKGEDNPKQVWGVRLPLPAFAIASGQQQEKRIARRHRFRKPQLRFQRVKYAPDLKSLFLYVAKYREAGEKFFAV